MKKKLLAVGDSWTYGDELENPRQAWPFVLAELLDYEVNNLGISGVSNASMIRRTLGELAINYYDLVVIGWTSPGRFEWKDSSGDPYDVWPGQHDAANVFVRKPWRVELSNYINRHHDSEYLYEIYLTHVISLQSYFQAQNIRYKMIDTACYNHYRTVGTESYKKLEAKIDAEHFIGWNKFGMSELTSNCPRGPGKHTLEQGHKKIATEIHQRL